MLSDKPYPRIHRFSMTLSVLMVTLFCVPVAFGRTASGVPLPKGVQEVGERRFASPLSYTKTIRWFERALAKRKRRVKFATIIDLPSVVASHAASPHPGDAWQGINVSRYDGGVWIFIIVPGTSDTKR